MVANHLQAFMTMRGGLEIARPDGRRGTLGMLLSSDGVDRWLVTCRHVLGAGAALVIEPGHDIEQPAFAGGVRIASTSTARTTACFDCAAARIENVPWVDEILGIGPVGQPIAPQLGMRMIKAGAGTGVTEGWIDDIEADGTVVIRLPPDMPSTCRLSAEGDSGAVWVSCADHCPVALHREGNAAGIPMAKAIPFLQICQALALAVPSLP